MGGLHRAPAGVGFGFGFGFRLVHQRDAEVRLLFVGIGDCWHVDGAVGR